MGQAPELEHPKPAPQESPPKEAEKPVEEAREVEVAEKPSIAATPPPAPPPQPQTPYDDQVVPIVTITVPATTTQLDDWAKGSPEESLTWIAVYWLRLIKKGLHFGWRILSQGGEVYQHA